MKKIFFLLVIVLFTLRLSAQTSPTKDTATTGKITIYQDSRMDTLVKKEIESNEIYMLGPKLTKGYRLMLLNTNNRTAAMNLRAQLLKRYPDQKVYMSYQPPYIKIKFGNFADEEEAEKFKKEIIKVKIVANNIYVLPEIVETKPARNTEKENE